MKYELLICVPEEPLHAWAVRSNIKQERCDSTGTLNAEDAA